MNNFLYKLNKALHDGEEIPNDFKTTKQWAKEMELGKDQTLRVIKRLIAKNLCEVKMFKVKNMEGYFHPTIHYKIKVKK